MSVYKRGTVWYVDVGLNGRQHRRSAGKGATRKDALALEAKLRREALNNRLGQAPERSINDALNAYVDAGVAPKTAEHIRTLIPFTTNRPLTEIHVVARELKEHLQRLGRAPATINRKLAILRRVANLAYNELEWLNEPLGKKVTLLSVRNERHVYLTPDEVETLAAACAVYNKAAADMVRLAAYTGLRKGELFRINDGYGQYRDHFLHLDAHTKTGRPRSIPVPPIVQSVCERMPLPLTGPILRVSFEKARRDCGMEALHFHDLRHTYASWLVQSGAPMRAVQELLGHSTLAMTQRYSHLSGSHLADAVSQMTAAQKQHTDE